ncbi:hypothetical protein TMatcc_008961 [Talaromyces marneffei ATCC 18224]|uniref:uncharacterized protein n=1 Tax=Talaromyces marneffei TaxID=37727 RepID=UPI0012A87E60|nr:uncharacterized protein EYB26_008268 [Talaromyces marneffei]KAE8550897.1 hypothetical protein EYB25_007129 [Talaromyces marneffei]QGA20562.1 hypothetical protein EYB26_008268 [Talaromyces marneffei]
MNPRMKDFEVDYQHEYDLERGLRTRNRRRRVPGSCRALLLSALIVAATLFGGIVLLRTTWTKSAGPEWAWSVTVPQIQARSLGH